MSRGEAARGNGWGNGSCFPARPGSTMRTIAPGRHPPGPFAVTTAGGARFRMAEIASFELPGS